MKTSITIVGIGQRKVGISQKTNKPYDFTPISFTFEDKFYEGLRAVTLNADQSILDGIGLDVGVTVDAVLGFDFKSDRVYLNAIL